jgi:hypothetical protein
MARHRILSAMALMPYEREAAKKRLAQLDAQLLDLRHSPLRPEDRVKASVALQKEMASLLKLIGDDDQ